MRTRKPRQRLPRDQRGRRRTPVDAGQALAERQLDELWAAYVVDRGNQALRNRLVEHYLPWVVDRAESLAGKMRLRERENAVAEVAAALVESIVPGYDGQSGFERWACVCTKRKLLNLRRAQRRHAAVFPDQPAETKDEALENVADSRDCGDDRTFGRITAELTDRQAVVLWLRGYCGLSVEAAAPLLKLSPRSVKAWTRSALAALLEK
jgi:RNA polymerase sigma factor (sigma-70 family)